MTAAQSSLLPMSGEDAPSGSARPVPSTTVPSPAGMETRPTALVRLGLLAALLVNWALLLAGLWRQSMWIDEWFTRNIAVLSWADFLPTVLETERRPPLHYALLKLWSTLAGSEELALRLYSAAAVVLAVALLYTLGVRLLDCRAALVAAWLLALSPFWLLYGRMIRSYSQTLLLALLATLLLVIAVRRGRGWWLGYVLAAAALLYTDYSGLPILAAHGVYVLALVQRRFWWSVLWWGLAMLGVGLLYLAWVPAILRATARDVRITDLAGGPVGFGVKLALPFYVWGAGETLYPWHPLGLLVGVTAGLLLLWGLWRTLRAPRPTRASGWLLLAWLGLPLLFTASLLALVATDITFLNAASRTPGAYPAFALLVGAGAVALRRRWLRWLAGAGLALGILLSLLNYYSDAQFLNPIYAVPARDVAARLAQAAGPDDLILAEPDTLVGYYYRTAPGAAAYQDVDPAANLAWIAEHQPPRVWLVTFGRDSTEGTFGTGDLQTQLLAAYELLRPERYGYVEPSYRAVKQRLTGRPAYAYKLEVQPYERTP